MIAGIASMRLGIIGGGRAAWAFGSGWKAAGRPLSGIALRPHSNSEVPERLGAPSLPLEALVPDSDLVLLAVPDESIPRLAPSLPPLGDAALFHPSGSLTGEVFEAPERGFSLHPLRSLGPVGSVPGLIDALLVYEGPDASLEIGREVAATVGGRFARIEAGSKSLYHAAAVLASNYVAALLEAAEELMIRSGLEGEPLARALASLAESAVRNWAGALGPARFTGPIARGDVATVLKHLEALGEADPARRELYRTVGSELARAVEKGAESPAEVSRMIDLLRS